MKSIVWLLISLIGNEAIALGSITGGIVGNGGKGVFCSGVNPSIEVLDLYEAREYFKLVAFPRQGLLLDEMALAERRLDETFNKPWNLQDDMSLRHSAESRIAEFLFDAVFIPPNRRLPLTEDATLPVVPEGCEIVQIALTNRLGLQIDRQYWEMLDARNQSALIEHEYIYRHLQHFGQNNSDEVRRFVGRLFSTRPPLAKFEGLPQSGYVECDAVNPANGLVEYSFYAYPMVEQSWPGTRITFSQIAGRERLGRTVIQVGVPNLTEMLTPVEEPEEQQPSAELYQTLSSDLRAENRGIRIFIFSNRFQIQTVDQVTGLATPPTVGHCRRY